MGFDFRYSYTPTAADAAVYEAVGKAPEAKYVNALRWYSHIASYGAEIAKFEGEKKEASFYGPEIKAAAVAAADDEDDDDIDLFGSDDEEEDAEAARIREERLAAYNAKKAASKYLNLLSSWNHIQHIQVLV